MAEKQKTYCGIEQDLYGGMTPLGQIVKDAWVFGFIPETETCENWTMDQMQKLYNQVQEAWDKHGPLPSTLPPEIREKHQRIHDAAVKKAKQAGWDADDQMEEH